MKKTRTDVFIEKMIGNGYTMDQAVAEVLRLERTFTLEKYLRVSRVGANFPLNRKKRKQIHEMFMFAHNNNDIW